jgi:transcriptional coactivator HFI1/ADA1
MLPICYESGLPSGHTADCAEYMNIATETYIKEALTNFFQRVSSNGGGFIKTAEYKRKVERDEERIARGELGRGVSGELPIEIEERRKRPPLCMEDLRLALEVGDSYLGQVPLISGQITHARFLDAHGVEELSMETQGLGRPATATANSGPPAPLDIRNGENGRGGLANGFSWDLGDPGYVMDDDWTWNGGSVQDVDGLDSVLDGCLAIGT